MTRKEFEFHHTCFYIFAFLIGLLLIELGVTASVLFPLIVGVILVAGAVIGVWRYAPYKEWE